MSGPTSEVAPSKKEGCRLASAFASAARWDEDCCHCVPTLRCAIFSESEEMNQAMDLAWKSVALMSHNIVSFIPMVETSNEPSHGPSAHSRESNLNPYSKKSMSEYLQALVEYVKAKVVLPNFAQSSLRGQYFVCSSI
ncbi:unnamed protein product [Nippostrongylus brasiliensis]|uniref:Mediator of RNA polymerase II transcription subunit 13 n=1 Tax=Nippostrongylus brasiliensis TaxID=27835 RepID=A0A0N4XWA0_NIPBR|nr:unnamed protein product [Nippostrongylus brasiliensis]